jgi:hypothetical protein
MILETDVFNSLYEEFWINYCELDGESELFECDCTYDDISNYPEIIIYSNDV